MGRADTIKINVAGPRSDALHIVVVVEQLHR